jgi:drug/metabolite transporter (DMT)-like permease
MKHIPEKTAGTMIAVAAVIVLSPDALLISLIKADEWTLIFWRGLLTAMTLSICLTTIHGTRVLGEFKKIGPQGILAGLFFGVSTFSFVISVRLTSAANTLVIVAAMPLIAAVLTRLFLKERVPRRTWMAVVAGFTGIAVIFTGSVTGGSPLGDSLALVTAVMMAANFVIIRSRKQVNMIPAVVLSGLMTTVVTVFMCDPFSVSTHDILFLTAIGAIVLPVPLALMTIAPKLIPAAEVGLILLIETFLGPFWVWLAIGEKPGEETFLGGGLLVLTLFIHSLAGLKEQQRKSEGLKFELDSATGDS